MKKSQLKLRKSTVNNLINYAIVAIFYLVVTVMIQTGNATRHMKSMLVPICIAVILAVSLNLVIGFLGELSLGHAAFMSIGAYTGGLYEIDGKTYYFRVRAYAKVSGVTVYSSYKTVSVKVK